MTEQEFWTLIEQTHCPDADEQCELINERLWGMPAEEVLDFGWYFGQMERSAYRDDLWAAALIINVGANDDGFAYFRCWLVLQGPRVYHAALSDPDSLADVGLDPDIDALGWMPAFDTIYEELTGGTNFYTALARLPDAEPRFSEFGEYWDFKDPAETRKRLPRLYGEPES